MDGGACTPDPEDGAKMLNALTEIGLVGPRLAVSHGSEESLARQLAERLGLEARPWHVSFVKGQVREAVQMADLDNRVVIFVEVYPEPCGRQGSHGEGKQTP